jgi:hypothetical protein
LGFAIDNAYTRIVDVMGKRKKKKKKMKRRRSGGEWEEIVQEEDKPKVVTKTILFGTDRSIKD